MPWPNSADARVVERRLAASAGSTGNGEERREHERREAVDGVLIVVLREEEHAGLPLQVDASSDSRTGAFAADASANLLRELRGPPRRCRASRSGSGV